MAPLRVLAAGFALLFFFAGGPLIGLVLLPLVWLVAEDREDHRRRSTRLLGRLHAAFASWMRFAGLIEGPPSIPALAGIAPNEPYLLVCNHPSLLDAVLLLGAYRGLTCVVKRSWYRSITLGPLLRQSAYLPGPARSPEHDDDVLSAMVMHLESGHALLVFPEGTRSLPEAMRRFRRGAVEAALRAQVPIVAVFLATDRPFLTKGEPAWKVIARLRPVRYELELLEVIDTRSIPLESARALNAELQSRYHARFAALMESRRAAA